MVVSDADFLQLKNQVDNLKVELGTDPSGIYPTVEDRVDAMNTQIDALVSEFSIPMAGDLSGVNTNAKVIKIQGFAVSNTTPLDGYVLQYNNSASQWQPKAVSLGGFTAGGDLTGSSSSQNVVDLTITGETNGSMLYFNGTNWVNRTPGSDGYILTANGAGAPTWNNSITGMTNVRAASYTMQPNGAGTTALYSFHDAFNTTSNTQITPRSLAIGSGEGVVVTCVLTGTDAFTGDGGTNRVITITKSGKYYRPSVGALTISGITTVQDLTPPYGDTTPCDLSLVINGNSLDIKVTGATGLNAKWQLETYVRVVPL